MCENAARYVSKSWEVQVETVPDIQGQHWCTSCDRWTERDGLPGSSLQGKEIPTFWFCTFCGIVDWDFEPEEAA